MTIIWNELLNYRCKWYFISFCKIWNSRILGEKLSTCESTWFLDFTVNKNLPIVFKKVLTILIELKCEIFYLQDSWRKRLRTEQKGKATSWCLPAVQKQSCEIVSFAANLLTSNCSLTWEAVQVLISSSVFLFRWRCINSINMVKL